MSTQLAPIHPAEMRRARRNRRILLAALALLVLTCIAAMAARLWLRHAIQASLPQTEGTLHVTGLAAPVRVERDAHGVPHMFAQSMDDLIFAQAYVTAQDRLWQMDMLRRHAAGELAEVLGSKLVEHDKTQRYLQLRATADRELPQMDPVERHQLERYAQGVNAAMAAAARQLPAEFRLLGYEPRPWTARDCLLVGFAMAEDLSTIYPEKLNREAVSAQLPPQLLADLYPVGSFRDHPPAEGKPDLTMPRDMPDIPLDESQTASQTNVAAPAISPLASPQHTQDLLRARLILAQSVSALRCESCAAGSNNWTVNGTHTATGKPLLANDMHLAVTLPGIWYTADLQAGDFHVTGVTLPGVPFVIVGHNAHVAWGFTNSGADAQDLYIEQISGNQFRAPDGSLRPVAHQHELIRVKHGLDVDLDIQLTQHGGALTPVISPMLPHETRVLSLRWTLFEPRFASQPFARVGAAASGAEVASAFDHFGGPSQNLVYADDAGHIGYHLIGWVPLRGEAGKSGIPPVPINTGEYEWSGILPYDQMPMVQDPASGMIATANARITPDNYPYAIALDWELPYRNERIWNVLGSQTGMTAASMTALQTDTFSALDKTVAERIAYAVDHAKSPSQRDREAADILRKWNGHVTRDSAAANITQAVRASLMAMLLEPHFRTKEAAALYTWRSRSYAMEMILEHASARWLPSDYPDWNEFLTAALDRGLKESHAPSKLAGWRWAATHTMQLNHPIYSSSWLLRRLSGQTGSSAVGLPGNGFTVRAASGPHGASERFVADLAELESSTMTLPQGESGNPGSSWYLDEWPSWTAGRPLPLPFVNTTGPTHTLTLTP